MKKYFLLLLISNSLLAQAPAIEWQKVYGGDTHDILNNVINTNDGGYLLSGWSYSNLSGDKTVVNFGAYDYWVIKISELGTLEWQKSLGGSQGDGPLPIIETHDGGYLIGGNSISNISGVKTEDTKGFDDIWILKLDNLGNIQWQKDIGGNANDWPSKLIMTPDGGYLIGGSSYSSISGDKSEGNIGNQNGTPDYWIIKTNNVGEIEWENTIGSNSSDYIASITNAIDGGFIIGGYSDGIISGDKTEESIGGFDCWILKLDIEGNILWQKTLGGSLKDQLRLIEITTDGNYLLGAFSNSSISGNKTENSRGGDDIWLIKMNVSGNIIWDKTIGGSLDEEIYSVLKDNNSNFYIGARSNSNISGEKIDNSKGGYDYWIINVDEDANILWQKTIGGSLNEFNTTLAYNQLEDSILIAGASYSSNTGDKTENSRGSVDYWVVKLLSDSLTTTAFNTTTVSLYPNPTNKTVYINLPKWYQKIQVSVSNVLGQLVLEKSHTNVSKIDFDLEGAKGIYFVNVENENNEKVTIKLVKE